MSRTMSRMHLRISRWQMVVTLVAGGLLASPAYAEGPALAVVRVDASQFPTVRTSVSVATSGGVPVTGLDAQAFSVQEDGRPVAEVVVEPVIDNQEPIALGVLIDTSGSMKGDSLQQAQK